MKTKTDTLQCYEVDCYRLLLERLQAIPFQYDVQRDVMVFDLLEDEGSSVHIADYRKKLYTSHRGAVHPDFLEKLLAVCMGQSVGSQEFLLDPAAVPQGRYSWYEIAARPILDDRGRVVRTVGILWNIEDRKGSMDTSFSRFRSERDPITGILNEMGMERESAAYLSTRGHEEKNALLILSLTDFSRLRSERGERWGDTLLVRVCRTLGRLFRATDTLGYIGNGKFAVFMKDIEDLTIVPRKAKYMKELFTSDEAEFASMGVSVQVGMALYPIEGRSYPELLEAASEKMTD